MKRLISILATACSLSVFAQRPTMPSMVSIVVQDTVYAIEPTSTQTEIKPGWKIVDYKLPNKAVRYLWGAHSHQTTENGKPSFVIRPLNCQLTDFALIRLKEKKQYRRFPSPNLAECEMNRIDLDFAKIELAGEDQYLVQPLLPLKPGEYVWVNTMGKPLNNFGDIEVFPFTVEK